VKIKWSIFILALGISSTLYAQSPSPTPSSTAIPSVSPIPNEEVIVLRAQLEVMRQYDQSLLSTVYWSLSVIVALVILLAGYGWYTNFRVYERDKNAMQQDLQGYLQQEIGKSFLATSEVNERFRGEMLADITQRIESLRAASIDASKAASENILEQLRFMKLDLRRIEGWYWENRESFFPAFITYIQRLEDINSLKGKFPEVSDANYELLFKDLERVLNNKFEITENFHRRVEDALNDIPLQFTEQVDKIRELLKART
jgi:hypothetical protein